MSDDIDSYDIPKPATVNYDWPSNLCRSLATQFKQNSTHVIDSFYDTPRSSSSSSSSILQHPKTITPSSSNSSLLTCDCAFSSSSSRLTLPSVADYDVPHRSNLPVQPLQPLAVPSVIAHQPISANERLSQNELPSNSSLPKATPDSTLKLRLMVDNLSKLQAEAILSISKLLSFVRPKWRTPEKLEPVLIEVKISIIHLSAALHNLSQFCEGVLYLATPNPHNKLAQKLGCLVKSLKDAEKLMQAKFDSIDANNGWTLEKLAIGEQETNRIPDSFHQLIECAKSLIETVHETASFIKSNASLLFKPNDLAGTTKSACANGSDADLAKNYEYVCFESEDSVARKKPDIDHCTAETMQPKPDTASGTSENSAMFVPSTLKLTERDKSFLKYYAAQITTHMGNLQEAIDSFLQMVEKNQPPKTFIAYGKFVVVSAHDLVTMGDIVHRNLSASELKPVVLHYSDALTEAIRTYVMTSKIAAAHFPSVAEVQDMVDSVVVISHSAVNLKTIMQHAVQLIMQ